MRIMSVLSRKSHFLWRGRGDGAEGEDWGPGLEEESGTVEGSRAALGGQVTSGTWLGLGNGQSGA